MSAKGGRNPSWSRLKPANQDIFEEMGLRSKGDAQLLDYKTQERFYEKIVERYKVFCSSAVRGDELHRRLAQLDLSKENENEVIPKASDLPNSKADVSNELDAIIMGMRKLREGIVASKRVDDFSIQAYIFCIRLSILRAIAHDNYFLFWRIKRGVDGHKAKIMEFAEDEMKLHALKSIGKTYLSIDLASLEQLTDTPWASLAKNYGVGWQLEGTKVVIRKPKAR
ncbi:sac3 ganp nin1 mts3 eif-3 p25 protein [Rutstroemia sp. NJR-2017a BBW]|nr:sac3 ganp nin1 mts3 eif-3 p25 protein [Rutstroemia sp. NJR-2017a BBW]